MISSHVIDIIHLSQAVTIAIYFIYMTDVLFVCFVYLFILQIKLIPLTNPNHWLGLYIILLFLIATCPPHTNFHVNHMLLICVLFGVFLIFLLPHGHLVSPGFQQKP